LIRFQPDTGSIRGRRALPIAVTVVCLLLLALLAVVQVAHVHHDNSESGPCAICAVLHATAPAVAAAAIVVLIQMGVSVPLVEDRLVVQTWHPALFTRPPPCAR